MIGNSLVSPLYLPDNFNSKNYLQFLWYDLPNLGLPPFVNESRIVFFFFFSKRYVRRTTGPLLYSVGEFLKNTFFENEFLNRWSYSIVIAITRFDSPLRLFVWKRTKSLVYNKKIQCPDQLMRKINNAWNIIKEEIGLRITTVKLRRKLRSCIKYEKGHVEQDMWIN